MSEAFTRQQLLGELSRQCEAFGSQAAWARARGVPASQVCEALSGRRALTDAIINAMGFSRVDRFVLVRRLKESA